MLNEQPVNLRRALACRRVDWNYIEIGNANGNSTVSQIASTSHTLAALFVYVKSSSCADQIRERP